MKFRPQQLPLLVALGGAIVLSIAGCNRAPETPAAPAPAAAGATSNDALLSSTVRSALLDDTAIKATDLQVTASAGNVRLSGTVDDQAQFDRAGTTAAKVAGVTSVENNLARPGTPTKASDNADDISLTTKVTTALRSDTVVKSFDIAVDSRKGDVRLTGSVDTRDQVDQAIKIARTVDGVHSVHDELVIAKPPR